MSIAQDDNMTRLSEMLQTDGLPGVLINNRPTRHISQDVVGHLVHAKTPIYVRHGQLVRVQRKEDGTPSIETLTETAFKGVLARAMNFVKITVKGAVHVAPPDPIVRDILSLGEWPFPPLDSIIEFPVFRPDGTLIDTPGYDAVTRLFYAPLPTLIIPPVAADPDWDAIVKALELIDEAIGEFPYQNAASKANAIGLLLTPIIRQSIRGQVPLALIDATRPGTGKSLLAETVAMIATGRKAAMMTAPYDDNEWRKRIASTLAEGATIIIIDNVKARLQAASLDAALTSSVVKERILGSSKNGLYPQRATWMATGNNIQIGGDLPRRTYWIRMDAHNDKPWTRGNFRHDLEEWVPAHRGELIAALLTIARAWFVAGKPPAQVPRLGNFQSWADTVGGILAHTEIVEGFLDNLNALYEQSDEDAAQWGAFLYAWHDLYQKEEVPVSQLAKDIKSGSFDGGDTTLGVAGLYNALPDDLADVQKGDFKRRLGKALSARVGAVFNESGLHLEKARMDKRGGIVYWKVAGLQVSQVSIPQKEEFYPLHTPLDQVGSGLTGILPSEKNVKDEGSKPAKPANLQDALIPEKHPGEPWKHFKLLDWVFTPQGEGIVIQDWPTRVGVRLNESQIVVYFEHPEDILKFRVKADLLQDSVNTSLASLNDALNASLTASLYSPNTWPYNDPEWTDERLAHMDFPTRAELGFPQPEQEGR